MCVLAVALGVVYWTVIRDVFALEHAHAISVPTSGVYGSSSTVVRPSPNPRPQGQTAEIVDHQNGHTLVLVVDKSYGTYHFEVRKGGGGATVSVMKQRGLDATADRGGHCGWVVASL